VAPKPPLFKLLAGIGILFGSLSAMYATFSARAFLMERGAFVDMYEEAAKTLVAPSPSPSPSPSPNPALAVAREKLPKQVAETLYARRGVILPLAGINLILSTLLLFGCLRAWRGTAWGLQAWTLTCVASIPYQVLNAASVALQTRDLAPFFGESMRPNMTLALLWMILCILYYGGCLVYLRRPQIRELFR
jgi:hypothetical protein